MDRLDEAVREKAICILLAYLLTFLVLTLLSAIATCNIE